VLGPEAVLDLVVRGPDRQPVPGAQVVVLAEGTEAEVLAAFEERASSRRLAERHTDVDGRVRVDGLPRGAIRVAAEYFEPHAAPTATRRRNRAVLALPVPGPAELLLPAVASPTRGQVVEGEILDERGERVRGVATAALQSDELDQNRSDSATGGRFHFDDVPAGRWQLQVYAEGDATPRTTVVEVPEGLDVLGLRIPPSVPGRLRGRVLAEGVADRSGLPVHAIDTQGLRHVRARATTDAAGDFLLDRLPPGRYVLELRAPSGPRVPLRVLEATPIDMAPGQDLRHDLNATPAARVVLHCDDARVGVRPEGALTLDVMRAAEAQTNLVLEGPQGAYPVEFGLYRGRNELPWALAPGRYRVRVRRLDGLEATREFDVRGPGDLELDVEFPPPPK
jgi:hypothetical protein